MLKGQRGRLTVPDVAYLLASFAFLGALYPVFMSGFESNMGQISPGTAWMFRLMLPLALLVMISMLYVKATSGVSR